MKYLRILGFAQLLGAVAGSPASSTSPAHDLVPRELGINCRGSGVCPLASFDNPLSVGVAQGLRDAIYSSRHKDSTTFNNGDHIICVSEFLKIYISGSVNAKFKNVSGKLQLKTNGKIGAGGE
jgi:Kp4